MIVVPFCLTEGIWSFQQSQQQVCPKEGRKMAHLLCNMLGKRLHRGKLWEIKFRKLHKRTSSLLFNVSAGCLPFLTVFTGQDYPAQRLRKSSLLIWHYLAPLVASPTAVSLPWPVLPSVTIASLPSSLTGERHHLLFVHSLRTARTTMRTKAMERRVLLYRENNIESIKTA